MSRIYCQISYYSIFAVNVLDSCGLEYTIDYTQSKSQQKGSYYEATYNIFGGQNTDNQILSFWIPLLAMCGILLFILKLIPMIFRKISPSRSDSNVQEESSQSSSAETEKKLESKSGVKSNIVIPQSKTDSTQGNANIERESNAGIVETDPDLQKKYCLKLEKKQREEHEFCNTVDACSEHSTQVRKTYSSRSKSKAEKKLDFKMGQLDRAREGHVELIDPDLDLLGPYCAQIQNIPNINSAYCNSSSHASSVQSHAESSSNQTKTEKKGMAEQNKKIFNQDRPLTSEFKQNHSETEILEMQNLHLR